MEYELVMCKKFKFDDDFIKSVLNSAVTGSQGMPTWVSHIEVKTFDGEPPEEGFIVNQMYDAIMDGGKVILYLKHEEGKTVELDKAKFLVGLTKLMELYATKPYMNLYTSARLYEKDGVTLNGGDFDMFVSDGVIQLAVFSEIKYV